MKSSATPASVQSDRDVRNRQPGLFVASVSRDQRSPWSGSGCQFARIQAAHDLLDERSEGAALSKYGVKHARRGKLTFSGSLAVGESGRTVGLLGAEACDVLTSMGPTADAWRALTRSVFERNR